MERSKLRELLLKDFVNLTYMKFHGGHTLERHIYMSDDEINKIMLRNNKPFITKYNSRYEAEQCFKEIINQHIDAILDWICDTNDKYLVVVTNHNRNIGTGIINGTKTNLTHSKAKFVRLDDNTCVLGFYLQTMYPLLSI